MPILNPFESSNAFNLASLTDAINILPNRYGKLQSMNLFPMRGVRTREIVVEEKEGVLNLIQSLPPGAPGWENKMGKRALRTFSIPHFPMNDHIRPEEYDSIRAFGTENNTSALTQIVSDHLQAIKNKHAITLEFLRMGALKGEILDADGSTLYNLYTEFGIAQETQSFELDVAGTEVVQKCWAVSRHMEDNLLGEIMSGVHVLCSSSFFDALTTHANVKNIYANWSAAANMLGGDTRKGFKIGGLTFEEYRGQATDKDGNVRKFIADDQAIAFPVGTQNVFNTYCAPADFLETVNTIGKPYYAKQQPTKFNRGIDIHTQSNVLPMCKRPGVLVTLTLT